ncbi:MAG: hypothetical protein KIT58_11610 [Planctomycetota bacterium]|nr:hypothetical protein [Planctomycetota bacterium]
MHPDDEPEAADDERIALPPDGQGYLAVLDEHGWFEDLPPAYAAQARKGVEAAYARGAHPAVGLAVHSVPHSDDAEPQWFGALLRDVAAAAHGLLPLEDAKVTKSKRGDYVAKARLGEATLQETLHAGKEPDLLDPILQTAAFLEAALEAQDIQDVTVGYFTDEAKVLHWYLRPRDLPLPPGLIPDDEDDPLYRPS